MGNKFFLYLSNMLTTVVVKELRFINDRLQAPFILIVLRVVQSILMNYWTIRIGQIFV